MTTSPSSTMPERYSESVRVRGWVIGMLGLVLGVTAGVMTGVAVRDLFVGDEPLLTGAGAAIFYITFALAVLIDVFVLFNFTNLSLLVSEAGFEFRYGMFGKTFKWDQIKSAEASDYRWITYGGWGIRFANRGRRAWSQLGVKGGVVVEVDENGADRSYFVSSRRPEELAEALSSRLIAASPAVPQVESAE